MKTKNKLLSLAAAFVLILNFSCAVSADQPTESQNGTVNGTPDKYVEVVMDNSAIDFGTFNISQQKAHNSRTDVNGKYVIFDSQYDLTPDQNISFDEGASNSNIFVKATYSGQSYPLVDGLNNSTWLFFKDSTATDYIQPQITGTLAMGGGGVTMPTGVTEIGSYSTVFTFYTTADAGLTWVRDSETIYVALGDDAKLYVSNAANLNGASFYTQKGDVVNTPFYGNNMTESSTFPVLVGDTATLDFGYYIAWDNIQGNADKSFYNLVDLPMHAAYNHDWTWNLTITGEYKSAV